MFIIGMAIIYFVPGPVGGGFSMLLVIAVIPFAAGAKKTSTLSPPLVVAEAFGRKHYGAIIGYFTGTLQLGIALSNPIIGTLYESAGKKFAIPFTVMGVLSAVALVLILLALVTSPLRKQKTAA
jgi:predicted MFS family arabinose efflux permease